MKSFSKPGLKYQFGRSLKPRFQVAYVASHASSTKSVDIPQRSKLLKWIRSLRQIAELKHKQSRFHKGSSSEQVSQEATVLFKSIARIASSLKFDLGINWQDCQLDCFAQQLHENIQQFSKEVCFQRIKSWKQKLRQSFDVYKHGDAAFAWLRSKPNTPIMALKNQQNQIVTEPKIILEAVEQAWQELFQQ